MSHRVVEIKRSFDYEEKGNSQDGYGYHISARFDNEIPFLPKSISFSERQDFIDAKMAEVSAWKKERVQKHLDAVWGKLSDVHVVDKMAIDDSLTKETKVGTSEIGTDLSAEIRKKKTAEK